MPLTGFQADLVLVFFVYGLAFFSMGLAMLLEAGRSPALAEARVLRPLAVFGLLHGLHEWLEIAILQGQKLGFAIPTVASWVRLGVLTFSFLSLVAYGVQVLRPPRRLAALDAYVGGGLLVLYSLLVVLAYRPVESVWIQRSDVLARYVLAVPGAILAGLALRAQSRQAYTEGRRRLATHLRWAAWGFAFYSLTQLFVSPVDFFPARVINAELFHTVLGVPIQGVRALLAIWTTLNLIRATQVVEKERQEQLLTAQQARLEAMQRVQEELVNREALRRDLLRHIVVAQEEERARIARELHDETAQALTAFSLNLAALRVRVPEEAHTSRHLNRLKDLSDQIARDINRLVHDLRPAQLDDLGLAPALEYLADRFHEHMGLEVDFAIGGQPRRLPPLVETVIFRVAQEALTNVVRHAGVEKAALALDFASHTVHLRVRDEGVGFEVPEGGGAAQGWGLVGMQERVESVGGQFVLQSAPVSGTTIEVVVPVGPGDTREGTERVAEGDSLDAGG